MLALASYTELPSIFAIAIESIEFEFELAVELDKREKEARLEYCEGAL